MNSQHINPESSLDDSLETSYNQPSMKKIIFSSRQLLLGVLLVALGGAIGYRFRGPIDNRQLPNFNLTNADKPTEYKDVDFGEFWQVWKILERDYLDPEKLDQEQMVEGAIGGLTSALGDPYTVYLPPVEQQRSVEDLSGSFYGIGIQLGYIEQTLAVIAPLPNTPADTLGIQAGDLILHVKDEAKDLDEDTTDWSLTEAVNNLRGEKGTTVSLTLYREGGELPFVVDVPRGEVVVPSAELSFVEHNGKRAAHIELTKFGDRTDREIEDFISQILLERPNLEGIVLDMRNNPGGFFDSAIDIAGEFIEGGVVVSQQDKVDQKDFRVSGKARLSNIPIVVVVNKGSASAAEILAGALRDRRDAKLVGEKTFGKGTVQDARQLSSGAGLHVTVARWLLPKGDWIHDSGIPVDVEVKDDLETEEDEVILKAIEVLAGESVGMR